VVHPGPQAEQLPRRPARVDRRSPVAPPLPQRWDTTFIVGESMGDGGQLWGLEVVGCWGTG
jgi:hypothetical protein